MSAQANNTMYSDLDKCVKVAEMSALKLPKDPFQPDPSPYFDRLKIQDQIAKEGFPKFGKLPAELRLKVWENAMPRYGVFTALMIGREEPMPQQPAPPAPMTFRVVYRLEPVPRDQQHDELRTRLDTMRAIQCTNSEAASEVQRAFPTTINCTGGKLRFNAEHDTLVLSQSQCLLSNAFLKRFHRYSEGAVIFADDWHKIPRKMAFDTRWWKPFTATGFRLQISQGLPVWNAVPASRSGEGFMNFLADCTRLGTFGLMYHRVCDERVMLMTREKLHTSRCQVLPFCHHAPELTDPLYHGFTDLDYFVASVHGLEACIYGLPPDQVLPNPWQGMTFGRPELQHLRLQAMIPAHPTTT